MTWLRYLCTTLLVALALTIHPTVGAASVPSNDSFANATPVASLPFGDSISIGDATTESGEPFFCTFMPQTVWYRYQATTSGLVRIGLTSSLPDAFVEVFVGTSFDNLGAYGCMPAAQGEGFFNLQAGSTYYFQVGTQTVEAGQIGLTVTAPAVPANDDFQNATPVQLSPHSPLFRDFVGISNATSSPDDPTDCFSGIRNVWYAVTASSDMRIGVTSTLGQPGFAVYTGTHRPLELVGCGGPQVFAAKKGQTYFIEALSSDDAEIVIGPGFSVTETSVNHTATLNGVTGVVTMDGTLACSAAGIALVTVDLVQQQGSAVAHGSARSFTTCPTASGSWSIDVSPDPGQSFTARTATVTVTVSGGGLPPFFDGDSRTITQTVRLT